MATSTVSFPLSSSELREAYKLLREEQPRLRIRDAAQALGASEAQLLALECGSSVVRLKVDSWSDIYADLKTLGRVMCLTRNEYCVHERTGSYENIQSHGGKMGLITGKELDLRLFYSDWTSAFAVEAAGPGGRMLRSIQFFDSTGTAIHKVYLKNEEGLKAYQALVEKYRDANQSPDLDVKVPATKKVLKAELTGDAKDSFLKEWSELKDTHDFFMLLNRHDVSRTGALRAAEGQFATKLPNDVSTKLLNDASAKEVPIMVFVGNEGAIQIHSGPVKNIVWHGEWINVIDPDFNLHLKTDGISETWLVRKPTTDGDVTSLELFDAKGELIVQFFGARKPGIPELQEWRDLANSLQG